MKRFEILLLCLSVPLSLSAARGADEGDALAEDLEVMSHLLAGTFGNHASLPHTFEESHPFASLPPRLVEPVHAFSLPSYGAVFQITLSNLVFTQPAAKSESSPHAETSWDRTRRALKGETAPEGSFQCTNCHLPSPEFSPKAWHWTSPDVDTIEQRLLDVLAENAEHLRGLGDDERIAIALSTPAPTKGDGVAWRAGKSNDVIGLDFAGAGSEGRADEPEISSTEYRADLLMRQGKAQAAVDAYLEALSFKEGDPEVLRDIPLLSFMFHEASPAEKEQRRRLFGKLSQAYILLGDYEKAEEFLRAMKPTGQDPRTVGSLFSGPDKAGTQSIPVRKRFVVSVTRRDVERLARGEITRSQFDERAQTSRYPGR